jgi:ribulose-5-phosphate 4-epimerase/fuculose-1-phosphate aldolase
VTACREAAARGLTRCSSGNLSLRVAEDRMLVTATGSWMGRLTSTDVVLCRIADGAVVEGPAPTVETALHAGALQARPDVNVVMHFQSPYATVLACQDGGRIEYDVLPEIPYFIGPVARVPYLPPGSPELAEAVARAMGEHDLVVMTNHGQVTAGRDFDQVIQNAEFFEMACRVIVQGGGRVAALSEEGVRALRAASADRRRQSC